MAKAIIVIEDVEVPGLTNDRTVGCSVEIKFEPKGAEPTAAQRYAMMMLEISAAHVDADVREANEFGQPII